MERRAHSVPYQAKKAAGIVALAAVALLATQPARADVVFSLDTSINGVFPTKVNNSLPALMATISDIGVQAVNIHFDTTNLIAQEFVGVWLFSVDGSGGLDSINFLAGGPGLIDPPVDTVAVSSSQSLNGGNQVKAGLFNIRFDFNTGGGPSNRFQGGQTLDITFTNLGAGTLSENSFLVFSAPDGNVAGGWYSAADLQGIPTTERGTTSGSIGTKTRDVPDVPEPGSILFMSMSGIALLGRKLRSRTRAI